MSDAKKGNKDIGKAKIINKPEIKEKEIKSVNPKIEAKAKVKEQNKQAKPVKQEEQAKKDAVKVSPVKNAAPVATAQASAPAPVATKPEPKVEPEAAPVIKKAEVKVEKPANEDVVVKASSEDKAKNKTVDSTPVKSEKKKTETKQEEVKSTKTTKSAARKRAHIVVVGNEKGGTGKSTISFHLAVNFLQQGLRVATVDLDGRQGTLTRYVQNRMHFVENNKDINLKVPKHLQVSARNYADQAACKDDITRLAAEIEKLAYEHDVIIIDTPGSNNHLFRAGHGYADTLITPINDSLIDFDVLAIVNSDTMIIDNPSKYSEFVWDVRKNRASSGAGSMQWIVVRNRLTHLDARNKRQVRQLINDLAKRIGCRTVPGLGERVIYRELFLKGLTVLDIADPALGVDMSMSHVSARRELRSLIDAIKLDDLVTDTAGEGAKIAMDVQSKVA
jgi:chromosome partitioning protein